MKYQSKTYSLSDEVVEAIDAARAEGLTPNRFLRRLLRLDEVAVDDSFRGIPRQSAPLSRELVVELDEGDS